MPQSKRKNIFVYSLLIVGSVLFGYHTWFVSSSGIVAQVASLVTYPVLVIQKKLMEPVVSWFAQNKTEVELRKELDEMHTEQENLIAENIALRASLAYAQDIDELLKFKKKYAAYNPHIAHILVKHTADDQQYFLVNAGSVHTIQKDMVAVYKNCLLGRVTDVYPWYSKVQLITDKECSIAAYCAKTKAKGIHQGLNKNACTDLKFVSHLDNVEMNDVIISSGEGLIFPQGFGLGRITHVAKNGLHHTIQVKPLLDFDQLDYVLLIAKK